MCRFKQSAQDRQILKAENLILRNVGSCLPVDTATSPLHFIVKNSMAIDKIRSIRDLYIGISDFKKGHQPGTSIVKDEEGDLVAYCYSIVDTWRNHFCHLLNVHSCQQKSIGLKFSKSETGNDVRYSCHHNSSRFTFPIFAHSCRFSVLHSLQSITPHIY